ncbi:MAG: type II toxin-antitoxin system VapB family antitoxin [Pseudonocardia sp.]|nr:type II toxin-antitoxin system VapB family antitoxin [Pseudonocardia sp.]
MGLNIKSDETHELTRELAEATGETLTEAVTIAVRERLERVRQRQQGPAERVDRILEIGRATAPRLDERTGFVDHGDLLYDELGLPR